MQHFKVIQIEDFHGYIKRCDAVGCRYFPVYHRGNGKWKFYKRGKDYLHFASYEALENFFKA